MKIVLVCLNRFQDHIRISLDHLLTLGEKDITVITQKLLAPHFNDYRLKISLVFTEDIPLTIDFETKFQLDRNFMDGFWVVTSSRFFYIYEWMRIHGCQDILHLENDVLTYYPSKTLLGKFETGKIYLPFDNPQHSVANIVYIPNHEVLGKLLLDYNLKKNDMKNFPELKAKHPELINTLPIFPHKKGQKPNLLFVTHNWDRFKFVFDTLFLGQFVSGIDPYLLSSSLLRWKTILYQFRRPQTSWSNIQKILSGNTQGFYNEVSPIKVERIHFRKVDGIKKPFLIYHDKEIPIFNLHIHSKALQLFI